MGSAGITKNKVANIRLLLCLLMACFTTHVNAGWRVVIDQKTTKAVAANAASQKAIEDRHNQRLDSISSKQQRLMKYTAAMESFKELYKLSMQNVTGFGEESKYYVEIFNTTAEIFKDIPVMIKFLSKTPVKNHLLCLNEMTDMVVETQGLISAFVDIVNNGRITLPDNKYMNKFLSKNEGSKNDGYNFLDRYERLTLANRIYTHLMEIRYKLEVMTMMCQYSGTDELFFAIDPASWAAYFTGINMVDGIINDWKGLGV